MITVHLYKLVEPIAAIGLTGNMLYMASYVICSENTLKHNGLVGERIVKDIAKQIDSDEQFIWGFLYEDLRQAKPAFRNGLFKNCPVAERLYDNLKQEYISALTDR